MRFAYGAVLLVHIVFAIVSVALFWVPVFARKGSSLHVRAGGFYIATMTVMAVTALVLTAMNLGDPMATGTVTEYLDRAAVVGDTTADDLGVDGARWVRLNAVWLGYLSLMILVGLAHGVRVLRAKGNAAVLRRPWALVSTIGLSACGIAVTGYGLVTGFSLLVVIGVLGVLFGATWTRFSLQTQMSAKAWTAQHLGVMLNVGIWLHLAMLLAVGRHLPGPAGQWRMIPAAIGLTGLPAAALHRRRYAQGTSQRYCRR